MNEKTLALLLEIFSGCKENKEHLENKEREKFNIGDYVIVRCRDAGVHFGKLIDYYDRNAILEDSRRIYSWTPSAGKTLSAIAIYGISHGESSIAEVLKGKLILPEFCEIIPMTADAINSIKNAPPAS